MALKEIAVNIIKGNVKTNTRTKNKLQKHKKVIIDSTKSKNCAAKRKKLVVQSGSWLWIIPLIASLIDLAL
jgi:hypothetical protein